MANIHNDVTEASELGSSYIFCEKVAEYLISWTVLNCDMLAFLHICNEEVSGVHVLHPVAAQCSLISFNLFATQIILMYLCWSERISLSAEEVTHPQNGWHTLMHANHLYLG